MSGLLRVVRRTELLVAVATSLLHKVPRCAPRIRSTGRLTAPHLPSCPARTLWWHGCWSRQGHRRRPMPSVTFATICWTSAVGAAHCARRRYCFS
jgi:hypothetical protein